MYYADIITKDDLIQEFKEERLVIRKMFNNIKSCKHAITCLLYTSDAADE